MSTKPEGSYSLNFMQNAIDYIYFIQWYYCIQQYTCRYIGHHDLLHLLQIRSLRHRNCSSTNIVGIWLEVVHQVEVRATFIESTDESAEIAVSEQSSYHAVEMLFKVIQLRIKKKEAIKLQSRMKQSLLHQYTIHYQCRHVGR